jgi:positive regulator of sigma E activity
MIDSEAVVARVEGDYVWLDVRGNPNCASCEQSKSCGSGGDSGKPPQRLLNTVGARVGDIVIVSVPDGAVLTAVLYSYLFPLTLTIGGAAVGMSAVGTDVAAMVGALSGLAIGWFSLRLNGGLRSSIGEPFPTMRIKHAVVHFQRDR